MYIREYYLPKKDDAVLRSVDPNSGKKASSVLQQKIGKTIVVKNLPANAGDPRDIRDTSSILGWEDSLEKEIAILFSILAWEIPWTEEPRGLQCVGLQGV